MVVSEVLLSGRWICDGGRGIGTLGEGRDSDDGGTTEVDGEDVFDCDRRWVGCEYGSCVEDRPMRLSTDRPS